MQCVGMKVWEEELGGLGEPGSPDPSRLVETLGLSRCGDMCLNTVVNSVTSC